MSEIDEELLKAARLVAQRIRARAIEEAPYRTRDLQKSITVVERGRSIAVTAGGDFAPYAVNVHEGTGLYGPKHSKYAILPKNKKALAWPGGKHPVKKVMHPGIKPNPFLIRAAGKTLQEVDQIVGPRVSQAASDEIKKRLKDIKVEVKI